MASSTASAGSSTDATLALYVLSQAIAETAAAVAGARAACAYCKDAPDGPEAEAAHDPHDDCCAPAAAPLLHALSTLLAFRLRPPRVSGDALLAADPAWPFVSETLFKHSHSLPQSAPIADGTELRRMLDESRGSVEVFIKRCLIRHSLHRWLAALANDRTAVAAYYGTPTLIPNKPLPDHSRKTEQNAVMRDRDSVSKAASEIEAKISPLTFHFAFESSAAPPPSRRLSIPDPTQFVHALSSAASANASALASSAIEIGKSTSSTASKLATNALGFGLQTLAAAKGSIDEKIGALNLSALGSSVQEKAATSPSSATSGVATSGGGANITDFQVVNTTTENITTDEASRLVNELAETKLLLAKERELHSNLQADVASMKLDFSKEIDALKSENSKLQKQLEQAKQGIQSIADI
ncbi:hypothetical protein HDU82_001021 [Entophlyctis luteolus]|nr:hypothetical protein HDU82_001021 [Entophlyctis luteolus]